jgi:low affinity Fe/Cu permease
LDDACRAGGGTSRRLSRRDLLCSGLVDHRSTFDWNAGATLAVFVMTLFIQRANRRDSLALHAKLDELLRVDNAARSELTQLDEQEPEVIARHRDEEIRKARA